MTSLATRWIRRAASVAALVSLLPLPTMAQSNFSLRSSTFDDGGTIPLRNSAYGESVSPDLSWSGAPSGTESFALVLQDPDAPMAQPFVHWVIYAIPGSATGLPEGLPTEAHPSSPSSIAGTIQGQNGARRVGYFGPRPPAGGGPHHYHFILYALDASPDAMGMEEGMGKDDLMDAIQDHVLGQTELVGVFERQQ